MDRFRSGLTAPTAMRRLKGVLMTWLDGILNKPQIMKRLRLAAIAVSFLSWTKSRF